jgi:hypothetical protein
MHDQDREFRDLMLERQALEFLLAHACETLPFYADRSNYSAADDEMEEAAIDALVFIAAGTRRRCGARPCARRYARGRRR